MFTTPALQKVCESVSLVNLSQERVLISLVFCIFIAPHSFPALHSFLGKDVAIKVYKTSILVFKVRLFPLSWSIHAHTFKRGPIDASLLHCHSIFRFSICLPFFFLLFSHILLKDRDQYVSGEFRWRHGYCKHNPRKMVKMWAEKEFRNLTR